MAYRLKRSDGSIQSAVRRIAREQVDSACNELNGAKFDAAETVHRVRRRCKQLRGLVRLVRPVFAGYADANAWLRELAAPLSAVRDADVMIASYDAIVENADKLDRSATGSIRRRLTLNRKALATVVDLDERLAACWRGLADLRRDIGGWTLDRDGFDAVSEGVAATYGRARKAMARAEDSGTAEDFHDWRKRVKYHWYHCRLLAPLWPSEMAARTDAANALGDLLGQHHDMAVLDHVISSRPDDYGGPAAVSAFCEALGQRQSALERRAIAEGHLLLSEAPNALVERWRGYWHAWHESEAAAA